MKNFKVKIKGGVVIDIAADSEQDAINKITKNALTAGLPAPKITEVFLNEESN
ncbi:hypothetical protein [Paucilactobacillus kaifaensis]|uniref:hypothetical protein n=1 Tax=Paucilactobacillus kaifaensis TaxID=2559921 RepID=UPI001485C220|nr:hypothetical protein [Paucilactobacillus kaifaensis]